MRRIIGLFTSSLPTALNSVSGIIACAMEKSEMLFDGTIYLLSPSVFKATLENSDVYTFQQMLKQPDSPDFICKLGFK